MTHTPTQNMERQTEGTNRAALDDLSKRVEEKAEQLGETGKEILKGILNAKEQLAKSELGRFVAEGLALLMSVGAWGGRREEKVKGNEPEEQVSNKTAPTYSSTNVIPETNLSPTSTPKNSPHDMKKSEGHKEVKDKMGKFKSYAELYQGKDTTIGLKHDELRKNPQFQERFSEIANRLGVHEDDLSLVIYKESKFNPEIKNKKSGATGLIQWLPSIAQAFGTSTGELQNMSGLEQLDWVYKFYKNSAGKLPDAFSLYLATFYPAALKKEENFIFGSEKNKGPDGLDRAREIAADNPIGRKYGGPFDPKYPGDDKKRLVDKGAFRRYVQTAKLS